MQKILVLGSGQSATTLIHYLLANAAKENWEVQIGELQPQLAQSKFPNANVIAFDIEQLQESDEIISRADLVISMMPASLHIHVARSCAKHGKHMLTASYVSDEIKSLSTDFAKVGKVCLMELGLDPGIDHMSAMAVLDRIKKEGHELTGFETFTGGLLSEETERDNPWKYKFTWNPRNVVMAGQGTVRFIQIGKYKYIPYTQLFDRTEVIHIPGHGYFEGYANRDSLKYLDLYELQGIKTLFRGTLRRPGFCRSWNIFVKLGATEDTYQMDKVDEMTHREFINSFLQYNATDSIELKLAHYLNLGMESEEMFRLKWLGLFDNEPIGLKKGTPAQILEHILKKKWTLNATDRDMIVMWHKFDFLDKGKARQIQAHMVVIGDDSVNTAMSKTVGLPLAIAAKNVLNGSIKATGVHIPTEKSIYEPILRELTELGFEFMEREV